MSVPEVEEEIRELIRAEGPVPFPRFQEACLYSPRGGFYSARTAPISASFQTAPTSHPVFGALLARQLQEMWELLGRPATFDVLEVGSGDGSLARSISSAAPSISASFADALRYVASDVAPVWPASPGPFDGAPGGPQPHAPVAVSRVRANAVRPFRNITGCILANELLDNFPVHRFAIRNDSVLEVFVGVEGDRFVEVLAAPSTPLIERRLRAASAHLFEGLQGEICLALDDWADELARVLTRGFVLTVDYGGLARDLWSEAHREGTLICFQEHNVGNEPLDHVGEQDITAHVDFSALMHLGEDRGLTTIGYTSQKEFLDRLGFRSRIAELDASGLSDVWKEFHRQAMLSLVDPEQTGDFRVLLQARGITPAEPLRGFRSA